MSQADAPAGAAAPTCIVVVMPAYRAAGTLAAVIARIPPSIAHVLVVDDASPDDQAAAVARTGDRRVELIRHPLNRGVGGACKTGFARALESHVRQLAVELSSEGITANAIKAGVTDTPALRKIPGNEAIVESAARRNPGGRLTTPEDVARCLVALSADGTEWLTGNVLNVDGGEDVAG
jgi:hypothetical protein